MRFNEHSYLEGRHAEFSPSKTAWMNYDEDKLTRVYTMRRRTEEGTKLHKFAADAIKLKRNLPDNGETLNMYVNDCIGWGLIPEQPLFYSWNFFGTADAIGFNKQNLKVSDLKTGLIEAKPPQLEGYIGLFCLEYKVNPFDIDMECRIYQNDDVVMWNPEPERINALMVKIVQFDKHLNMLRKEGV